MADTAVAKRPSTLAFTDPTYSSALDIDSFDTEDNDYAKLKKLQRHLE
jgi:26S proteasome regulatory subunit T3